ncbi:hypothetical protein U6X42_12255, partial [Cutibacterium acnes]
MIEQFPILSLIVFSPLLGVLALLFVPKEQGGWIKRIGIGTTFLPLIGCAWVYSEFDLRAAGAQFVERVPWIHIPLNSEVLAQLGNIESFQLQFDYALALDGISLPLVLMTAIVAVMAGFASVH